MYGVQIPQMFRGRRVLLNMQVQVQLYFTHGFCSWDTVRLLSSRGGPALQEGATGSTLSSFPSAESAGKKSGLKHLQTSCTNRLKI